MDVAQQYSNEVIYKLLKDHGNINDKVLDFVQILMMKVEEGEKNQKSILADLTEIKQTTQEINSKIDVVLEKLDGLEREFGDLKNEERDVEQKIQLMASKLSKLDIASEELDDYYALSQSLYMNWEDLDVLTKSFIPLAEYLYSKLQKYDKPDYSPVILELCRAIENEFLLKIFRKYTLDLVGRKGSNLDVFLTTDRASHELKDKTGQFVKAVAKAAKTNKPEYTLGQMNTILSIICDSHIVSKSPLLKDFVEYLKDNTEINSLLDSKYIKKINDIVNKYRNPSAHPEFMSKEKANECRAIMPDRLDYLMKCVSI